MADPLARQAAEVLQALDYRGPGGTDRLMDEITSYRVMRQNRRERPCPPPASPPSAEPAPLARSRGPTATARRACCPSDRDLRVDPRLEDWYFCPVCGRDLRG